MRRRGSEQPLGDEAALGGGIEGREKRGQQRDQIEQHDGHGGADRDLGLPKGSPRERPLAAPGGQALREPPPLFEPRPGP